MSESSPYNLRSKALTESDTDTDTDMESSVKDGKSSSSQKPTSEQKVTEVKDASASTSNTEKEQEEDSTEKASKKKDEAVGESNESLLHLDLTDVILKENADVRPKNKDKNKQSLEDLLIMPNSDTLPEREERLKTVQNILKLLDTSKAHQQHKAVNEEITLRQQIKEKPEDSQLKTQLDNTAIIAELTRIRDNYHTLWKQNVELRERNDLLEAQANSLCDISEEQTIPHLVNVNSNNMTTRKVKFRQPTCTACDTDDLDDDDYFQLPGQDDQEDEMNSESESSDEESEHDSSKDELKKDVDEIKIALTELAKQFKNANANARPKEIKPTKKVKKTKVQKQKIVLPEPESSDEEDTDVLANTDTLASNKFTTRLRYFDESGKEPWDDYVVHFKNCARAMRWPKEMWATYLGTQLKGKTMKVFNSIPESLLKDFDYVIRHIGQKTMNYRIVSKAKLNAYKLSTTEDFQKSMMAIEADTQLAYPDAPESYQNERAMEIFLEALPTCIREKMQPALCNYKDPTDLACTAEEVKNYMKKSGALDGKQARIGQVNVQNTNNNASNSNGNKQSNNNNGNRQSQNRQSQSSNNNNNGSNNSNRPTPAQKQAMKDMTCYKCGFKGHKQIFCRVPQHKWKSGSQTSQNGNQNRNFNNQRQNFNQSRNFQNQSATNVNRTMTMDSDQMAGCIREVVGNLLQSNSLNANAQSFTPSNNQSN